MVEEEVKGLCKKPVDMEIVEKCGEGVKEWHWIRWSDAE